MAYKHTSFEPIDNSGAERCLCVQLYKKRKNIFLGENFRGIVKKIRPKDADNPKVKKGEKLNYIAIRTKLKFCEKGIYIKFFENSALTINKKGVKQKIKGLIPANTVKALPFKVEKRRITIS